MGDLSLAQENLEKTISILEDSGEDFSFFSPYHAALGTMIEVAVDKGDLGLAQQYLERLKVLKSSGKLQSRFTYNVYQLNKALVMKRSPLVRQRNKAEETLKQIIEEQEQFEIRIHKRLLDILEPTQQTVDALMKLDLAAGVDVEIKL